jgi:hypothetical protein
MAPRYYVHGCAYLGFAGSKILTVHPEHIRSLPSMAPRYTVHPEHIRSLPSMAPRYTVHPEHKKPQ